MRKTPRNPRKFFAGGFVAVAVCLLALAVNLSAAVLATNEWEFRQDVDVPEGRVLKLALPVSLIGAGQAGLADLRLTDAEGQIVPFLVLHPQNRTAATVPTKFTITLKTSSTVIDIEVARRVATDTIALEFAATRLFKAATVEGSNDQMRWEILRRGAPVFLEPGGAGQTSIKFPQGEWPFLRVTLDDRKTSAVPVTGVVLREAQAEPVTDDVVNVTVVDRSASAKASSVVVDLTAANLLVDELEVITPEPLFQRRVEVMQREVSDGGVEERPVGSGTVYKVELEDLPGATNLFIPVHRSIGSREVVLTFANGDSPALKVSEVRAHVRPTHVVFGSAKAGRYSFWTGNRLAKAPQYDVAPLGSAVTKVATTAPRWQELVRNPTVKSADVLAAVGALGGAIEARDWSVRRSLTIGSSGIAQLELDLMALSGAKADLADIRLANGGRQVPFLFDHTSLTRPVPIELKQIPDAKRPTMGRWQILLPMDGVPMIELALTSPTPLFDRTVRLVEIIKGSRGEEERRLVQEQRWVHTPENRASRLVFSLNRTFTGRVLELETDNGDNPPIEITSANAIHPAVRMLFKSPADGATELLYANPAASRPKYDLGLLADEVLASPRVTAVFDGVTTVVTSRTTISFSSPWILWTVLALVVVGLLLVMAKLLPKPGDGGPK